MEIPGLFTVFEIEKNRLKSTIDDIHTDGITISMQSCSNTDKVLDYIKSEDFEKVSDNIKPALTTVVQFLNWYNDSKCEKLDIKNIDYCMNMIRNIIIKSKYSDIVLIKNNENFKQKINLFYIAYLKCHIKHNVYSDQFHEILWHFTKEKYTPEKSASKYRAFLKEIMEYSTQECNQKIPSNLTLQQTPCSCFPYELVYVKTTNIDSKNTIEIEYDKDLIIDDLFQKINLMSDNLNHPDLAKAYTILEKRKISNDKESLSLYDALASVINYILVKKDYKVNQSFWEKWNTAVLDYFEEIDSDYIIPQDIIESYCSLITNDESKVQRIKNKFQSKPDVLKQSVDQESNAEYSNNFTNSEIHKDSPVSTTHLLSFIDYLPESVTNFLVSLYDWIVNCFYGTISE